MTDTNRTQTNITAIILTYNEEENIGACIARLDWVDDLIVVDSGSTDRTCEFARASRHDVRIFENTFEDFGQQRNWALDETAPKHPWILFLDADEQCTPEMRREIETAIESDRPEVGYYLCAKNIFLGQWIRRSTFFPSWQLRLLRHGEVRFAKMGHGQTEVTDGPLGWIKAPYDHHGFSKGIAHWVERHNKYSTSESEYLLDIRKEPLQLGDLFSLNPLARRRCLKKIASRMLLARPMLLFIYLFFIRLGFLDGKAGLVFAMMRSGHEANIVGKVLERKDP